MFGFLATNGGYTPDAVRAMTLADVDRLGAYWKKHPPVRALVALIATACGWKPPSSPADEAKHITAADMRRIMATTGGRVPGVGSNMGR